ncbi:TetR/AcrR family transcriptional regulator [[Mycobacterium] wendilense]|uniref:TetR/AcrR family transcriptional regulator n=1 Tax=[Mycobacterium] wendilense TaxID=3064284 RepID=A0ABN9P5P3_9MYCO|nr:TetR/AcrR family transcriptional regulator [Mycolicibacterium sp. MU0050]CAJ1587472.1 TetR/AcrR family transcriptional regulator [Mycolicibacterium sp. MU0050]
MSDHSDASAAGKRPSAKPPRTPRRFQAAVPRAGDERRDLLLDSLENLLTSIPVADLSMEAIASAASLSRTSVYFYFGNKGEAVDALIARATEQMQAQMFPRTRDEPLRDFVARIVAAALDGWRRHCPAYIAAVELSASRGPGVSRWRMIMSAFAEVLAQGVLAEDAELSDADAQQRGAIVCWMVERNFYFLFTNDHTVEEEETLAAGLTQAAHAVLAAPR